MSFAITAIGVALVGMATSISLSVVSAAQQRKAARKQLEAQAMQAKVQAEQRVKSTKKLAAQQKASFLASGISLTGDGTPDAVISSTYQVGMEDVDNIKKYGAVMGDNISANARARMLSTYGQMASDVSSYASSAFSSAGSLKAAGGTDIGGGLEGMGDSYGGLGGMGEGAGFGNTTAGNTAFNNYQAPSSFGGGFGA